MTHLAGFVSLVSFHRGQCVSNAFGIIFDGGGGGVATVVQIKFPASVESINDSNRFKRLVPAQTGPRFPHPILLRLLLPRVGKILSPFTHSFPLRRCSACS